MKSSSLFFGKVCVCSTAFDQGFQLSNHLSIRSTWYHSICAAKTNNKLRIRTPLSLCLFLLPSSNRTIPMLFFSLRIYLLFVIEKLGLRVSYFGLVCIEFLECDYHHHHHHHGAVWAYFCLIFVQLYPLRQAFQIDRNFRWPLNVFLMSTWRAMLVARMVFVM